MTAALLREFLLNTLDDDRRDRIESFFLTDPQARDKVLTAEQDLIEDYLEDHLNNADKERFLALYAQTDEQRQKLRITRSIKDLALTEARPTQNVPVSSRLRLKALLPIAAIIVLAIVLSAVWLNRRTAQRNHSSIEQELAQLNSPSRTAPPQMISLELRPVTVRGTESQPELNPTAGTQTVELRLPWIQKEHYPTYRAQLRRISDNETFTIRNLQPSNNTILLKLPTHLLHRGQYQILLTGLSPSNTPSLTEEYNFSVR